jgi:hypothetical protein
VVEAVVVPLPIAFTWEAVTMAQVAVVAADIQMRQYQLLHLKVYRLPLAMEEEPDIQPENLGYVQVVLQPQHS